MTAPLHTRPFNLEHAKAGAPFACRDGEEATVLKWDARYPGRPILGIVGQTDQAMGWSDAGSSNYSERSDLVMTPLGMVDGKPVFVGDELIDVENGELVTAKPAWSRMNPDLWRWPAPAPVYPETRMSWDKAMAAVDYIGPRRGMTITEGQVVAIANAALRHAIDNGQVLPVEAILGAKLYFAGDRAARDMAIAEAVRNACRNNFIGGVMVIKEASAYGRISNISLEGIIKRVKA